MALERRWGAASVLLALVTVLVFVPGLSDEFTWDDNGLIRTNENIQHPERYREALTTHFWNVSSDAAQANETYNHIYRPLVTFAYIVQFRLFGLHAAGYRVVSLALHLLCGILALLWLRRRIPSGEEAHRLLAIGLGSAVFALHPSRAEAVSWISGSTELWMCALVLSAALAFDSKRSWLAGVLLALALFAKESAIVAAPLLLADRFLLQGRRERSASIALVAPVVIALFVRVWAVDVGLPGGRIQGALPRVLASFGLYAQQILSPWNPTAFPGLRLYECDRGEFLPAAWWIGGALVLAALILLGLAALRRSAWRPVLADALWVAVPLLPVVNLIDLGSRNLTADRFLYLPMLGIASLLARGVVWTFRKRASLGRTVAIAACVVVLGLAVVTSLHSRVFASSSSLWEYEVTRNRENPFALHAVGTARTRAGLQNSGFAYLEEAHALAARTCVRDDELRAAKDLAWALALRTPPDDRGTLIALQSSYAQVPRSSAFDYRGRPAWRIQLTPEETSELLFDDLQYTLPRATVEARLGNIGAATQIVLEQAASSDALHPLLQNLEIRLLAAEGGLEEALREVAEQRTAADADGLRIVLAALHEALWRTNLPSDAQTRLVRYALGFGQAPSELAGLLPETQAVLGALRAYASDAPVDLAALEQRSANSRQLPRFIELVKAKAEIRRFDEQLRSLALSKTSR
ncbi:MAG: hypothetical protein KJO40_15025 [Deltaproteobacteria bacterium]|nr:hypothetical protein [Deltaproteobacteria bacterium]NND28476.1 hypothetical protein [Myxococcales bacterium]MBT8466088.1 hypothetical protein [Deltaproteobacteria bacterium]MBT8481527.1 hypothetical protein [Deltaproteobacteria bacterium]NNK06179.1 hypothetical protein [Myxococcales bacterium]